MQQCTAAIAAAAAKTILQQRDFFTFSNKLFGTMLNVVLNEIISKYIQTYLDKHL